MVCKISQTPFPPKLLFPTPKITAEACSLSRTVVFNAHFSGFGMQKPTVFTCLYCTHMGLCKLEPIFWGSTFFFLVQDYPTPDKYLEGRKMPLDLKGRKSQIVLVGHTWSIMSLRGLEYILWVWVSNGIHTGGLTTISSSQWLVGGNSMDRWIAGAEIPTFYQFQSNMVADEVHEQSGWLEISPIFRWLSCMVCMVMYCNVL